MIKVIGSSPYTLYECTYTNLTSRLQVPQHRQRWANSFGSAADLSHLGVGGNLEGAAITLTLTLTLTPTLTLTLNCFNPNPNPRADLTITLALTNPRPSLNPNLHPTSLLIFTPLLS